MNLVADHFAQKIHSSLGNIKRHVQVIKVFFYQPVFNTVAICQKQRKKAIKLFQSLPKAKTLKNHLSKSNNILLAILAVLILISYCESQEVILQQEKYFLINLPRSLLALNSAESKKRHKLTKNNQPEGKSIATCAYQNLGNRQRKCMYLALFSLTEDIKWVLNSIVL